jgi:hypothetical protein
MSTIKLCLGDDIRRIRIGNRKKFSYAELSAMVSSSFPNLDGFVLKYEDDEKELCTVASDMELAEAFQISQSEGFKCLRLIILSPSITNMESKSDVIEDLDVFHTDVTCDGCGQQPIRGTRYKCAVCTNFDFCGSCESVEAHDSTHPFLKIKDESQAPAAIMAVVKESQWKGGEAVPMSGIDTSRIEDGSITLRELRKYGGPRFWKSLGLWERGGRSWRDSTMSASQNSCRYGRDGSAHQRKHWFRQGGVHVGAPQVNSYNRGPPRGFLPSHGPQWSCPGSSFSSKSGSASAAIAPRAKYVCDIALVDAARIAPSSTHVKTWRMQNPGPLPWPSGARLVHVGGSLLGGPPEGILLPELVPGSEVDVSFTLVAPDKPGRYVGYWRSVTADGRRFGSRIWVDVVVFADELVSSLEREHEEIAEAAGQLSLAHEDDCAKEDAVSSNLASVFEDKESVDGGSGESVDPPARWANEMRTLANMGFCDQDLVLPLLDEHDGNLGVVIQQLLVN